MTDDGKDIPIRIQTAGEKTRQKRQYEELMRAGQVERAVIVAELTGGRGYHVLGQGMSLDQIAQALLAAAHGISVTAEKHGLPQDFRLHPEGIGKTINPEEGREAIMPPIPRQVRTAEDGTLVWPKGETAIRCGECDNPSFYVAVFEISDLPARLLCTRCGNEIKLSILTGAGTA